MWSRSNLLFVVVGALSLTGNSVSAQSELVQLKHRSETSPVFVFQDSFWVNLHHFLRAEAWRRTRKIPLELPLAGLTPPERITWEAALEIYAAVATRSLIFDEEMVRIDNSLAMAADTASLSPGTMETKIVGVLNSAAPVFRAHRWNQEHRENREWISDHASSIAQHAPAIKAAITQVFGLTPPEGAILVDVVRDVGPNLAYTTEGPKSFAGHTFISPQVNANPDVALDTILHEISHTMDDQIVAILDGEATRQHVKIPSDLWHAMTLYTTYKLVLHEVGKRPDDVTYAPSAHFPKMFTDDGWPAILVDLDKFWLPHLEGRVNLSEALAAVVRNAPHT